MKGGGVTDEFDGHLLEEPEGGWVPGQRRIGRFRDPSQRVEWDMPVHTARGGGHSGWQTPLNPELPTSWGGKQVPIHEIERLMQAADLAELRESGRRWMPTGVRGKRG